MVRAFEEKTDRLVATIRLFNVGIEIIRSWWPGHSDQELVGLSLPVDEDRARLIVAVAGQPLRVDIYDYFVDFFSEESGEGHNN